MFDLNNSIADWRSDLAANGNYSVEDLDELESHLREQVDALRRSGLSDEEAFWVAGRRLGNADSLSSEFAKVNGGRVWANRLLWMMGGVLIAVLAKLLGGAAWWGVMFAGSHLGLSGNIIGAAGATVRVLVWILPSVMVCTVGCLVTARSARRGGRIFFPFLCGILFVVILGAFVVGLLSPNVVPPTIDDHAYFQATRIGYIAGLTWSSVLSLGLLAAMVLLGRKQGRVQQG